MVLASAIPWPIACVKLQKDPNKVLAPTDFELLMSVQNHLFPKTRFAPGADEFNAAPFVTKTLKDPRKDPDVVSFLITGLGLVKGYSQKMYQRDFTHLLMDEKEAVFKSMCTVTKGENWLSAQITLILEALFSDPLYGGNTQEIGWKSFEHQPGVPRPKSTQLYSF